MFYEQKLKYDVLSIMFYIHRYLYIIVAVLG